MHTGREGMSAMPYFDDFDLGTVDILLISQYVHASLLLSRLPQFVLAEYAGRHIVLACDVDDGVMRECGVLQPPSLQDCRSAISASYVANVPLAQTIQFYSQHSPTLCFLDVLLFWQLLALGAPVSSYTHTTDTNGIFTASTLTMLPHCRTSLPKPTSEDECS